MKKIEIIFFIFSLSPFLSANDEGKKILSEEEVVQSALTHYPLVLSSYQDMEAKEGALLAAKGAFDAKFKSYTEATVKGFYRRRFLDNVAEKPLGVMGSKIYLGHSYGPGVFPPMYNLNATNDRATPRMGFSLSLLRNRDQDEPRTGVMNARLDSLIAQNNNKAVRINVNKEAAIAYWSWAAALLVQNIYEELLKMAQERDNIFKAKVAKGDMPQIILTENNQYLARRRSDLAQAQLTKQQAAINLSLFYRNDKGEAIVPEDREAPSEFPSDFKGLVFDQNEGLNLALENRPEFKSIGFELNKIENNTLLAQNYLMPLFDVNADYTRNIGCCDTTNHAHIYTIGIRLEIPLERDLGTGKLQEVQANRRYLEFEKQLLQDTVKNEINKKHMAMDLTKERVKFAAIEVEMAKKLSVAENYRFKKGDSNLFLINLREEALSDAQVKLVDSELQYLTAFLDYKAETASFKGL